ncbi:hypothetical protein Hamer_G008004 [Homarus americanus]|uniref:Uncharacterized protein n=1 Tax=Homarus americanus TaxID=6706 RepID=A0A8J5JZU3_HOMAM|nr:hypothetical protein Hamer_G008004 [Homarus americanus]
MPVLKVTAKWAVVIPPRSEVLLSCKVNGALHTRLGVVQPYEQCGVEGGVMTGRTLVDPSAEEVPVIVANLSFWSKKIQQGVAIGLCQEVDQEQQPRTCKRSVVKQKNGLPDHCRTCLPGAPSAWMKLK